MRYRRAAIYHFGGSDYRNLVGFFNGRGYETFVLTNRQACPVYGKAETKNCPGPLVCSDIMVAIQNSEQTLGSDLFSGQVLMNCRLKPCYKAIVCHANLDVSSAHRDARGIMAFGNPIDFIAFEAWVRDCESRMDLSQGLAVRRRGERNTCSRLAEFRINDENKIMRAEVVNISNCGMCLKTKEPLQQGQWVHIESQRKTETDDGIIRWVRAHDTGIYFAGIAFCL